MFFSYLYSCFPRFEFEALCLGFQCEIRVYHKAFNFLPLVGQFQKRNPIGQKGKPNE